ncbi:putative RNase H-like HicB family nuclease [Lactobacillus colini]|uniref:RNase H-like HicB family nuclease n=1 Tax=Lactobacillus colini TaxID=1819254 RepID=A0ABS4MBL1_9LACO|nr:type II toxin-antitoxin system HicB family antitoxin [Lactobacillus colini]MBP2056998.1 putative RNase H-like HicB family nuclease [Lactobacillus colini]
MRRQVLYPVIVKEYNDDEHYFVITSPNVQGMVAEGETLEEAVDEASYDIADWFVVKKHIEKPQNPSNWHLDEGERIAYIQVDLSRFYEKYGKKVRRNITVPEYLSDWATENKVNVSLVASNALKKLQEQG